MAWIESHQALGQHPKTRRLARYLNVSLPAAVGHLHYLWWWALDYAQDGDLSKYEPEDIADAAMWEGDAEEFVAALVKAGFLDQDNECLRIHDWYDYAGRLLDQRQHAAEQKRRHREFYNNKALIQAIRERDKDRCRYCGRPVNWKDRKGLHGATYDYVDPNGPTSLENIVVACRVCNAGKGQRTPKEAGYVLLPPPDEYPQISTQNQVNIKSVSTPTKPNHTKPNNDQNSGCLTTSTAQGAEAGSDKPPTNKDLIAELTERYRAIEGIQPAKGDFAFIGVLYNKYGYHEVLVGLNELEMAVAMQQLEKPLLYLKAILERRARNTRDRPRAQKRMPRAFASLMELEAEIEAQEQEGDKPL